MKTGNLIYCGLMLIMLTILGCGGGGGSSSDDKTGVIDKKLVTSGSLPPGITIRGIQVEINLPSGVSVKSDSEGVLASYLQLSGVATISSVIKGNISGNKLTINMATPDVIQGIAVGEFATLFCDVASSAPTPLGNFSISPGFKITGYDSVGGNTVSLHEAPYNLSITLQ